MTLSLPVALRDLSRMPSAEWLASESGRPTLRLDDFIVAMRTVGKSRQVGCSIDPVPAPRTGRSTKVRQPGSTGKRSGR